ncbi:hypothetical protein LINPERPRIM_LOCUS38254, partial [Linum perenne]
LLLYPLALFLCLRGICRVDPPGFSGGLWLLWHSSRVELEVILTSGQGHGSLGGTRETVARLSIWERLGRALANAEWGTRFAEAVVVHFPRINSDHSPILLRKPSPSCIRISTKSPFVHSDNSPFSGSIGTL